MCVCVNREARRAGRRGLEWPAPWRSHETVVARAPPPGTTAGRRRGCVRKCKLKLDQQSARLSQSMLRRASVQPAIYKLNPALSSSFRTHRSITARRRGEDAAGSRCLPHFSPAGWPRRHPAYEPHDVGSGRKPPEPVLPRLSTGLLPRPAPQRPAPAHSLPPWTP